MILQVVELPLRTGDQISEDEPVEHRQRGLELLQRPPESQLSVNPERDRLELDYPAERRVAEQLTVRLEPAELLSTPAGGHLQRIGLDVERPHDLEERLAIRVDLCRKALQERAEARVAIAGSRAFRQLGHGRSAREVIVQVDLKHTWLLPKHAGQVSAVTSVGVGSGARCNKCCRIYERLRASVCEIFVLRMPCR